MTKYYMSKGTFHSVPEKSDELRHYGVIGMKWGKRRAQRFADKAKLARDSANEWDEIRKYQVKKLRDKGQNAKADKMEAYYKEAAAKDRADAKKYESKSKEIKAKHERLAGKDTFKRVSNASGGKTVAQALVFGTYGAVKYNQARARGASRGKAAVEGMLFGMGNGATYGILGIAEPRMNDRGKK